MFCHRYLAGGVAALLAASAITACSSDKGVHTFSWTFNALGSQSIKVQDTANAGLLGSVVVNVVAK